jgi:hypothetical protein
VVSLARALGHDERPDLVVEWPAYSLIDRQEGRLGLIEGRYDAGSHRLVEPTYATLSVPQALRLCPQVAELLAAEDARWSRSLIGASAGHRLQELVAVSVLPGPGALDSLLKQLAPEKDDRLPSEVVGTSPLEVRPELFLGLVAMLRRHPELLEAHAERVRSKVRLARSRMTGEQERAHAAEAAHAVWSILGDRADALRLLGGWSSPQEPLQSNYSGADALALPLPLAFAHLARCDPASDLTRAFAKHHLLDPAANDLDLGAAVPLPAAFFGGLPVLDARRIARARTAPDDALTCALVAQFGDWVRVGRALVRASAAAAVDRMPSAGPRPPDDRGVTGALHVLNDSPDPLPLAVGTPTVSWLDGAPESGRVRGRVPAHLPPLSALTVELGALDDRLLEPGASYEVRLPVSIGGTERRFVVRGVVGSSA